MTSDVTTTTQAIAAGQRPQICWPARLEQRVHATIIDGLSSYDPDPPPISAAEATQIERALEAASAAIKPAPQSRIIGHVTQLRAHYYVPDYPEAEWSALLSDYADDLAEYPEWVIIKACRQHRRNDLRQPAPAIVRRLCDDILARFCSMCRHMQDILNFHRANPDWRWNDGDPEPPSNYVIRYQRAHAAHYNAEADIIQIGNLVGLSQIVPWGRSVDTAKDRARKLLSDKANQRGLALADIHVRSAKLDAIIRSEKNGMVKVTATASYRCRQATLANNSSRRKRIVSCPASESC